MALDDGNGEVARSWLLVNLEYVPGEARSLLLFLQAELSEQQPAAV